MRNIFFFLYIIIYIFFRSRPILFLFFSFVRAAHSCSDFLFFTCVYGKYYVDSVNILSPAPVTIRKTFSHIRYTRGERSCLSRNILSKSSQDTRRIHITKYFISRCMSVVCVCAPLQRNVGEMLTQGFLPFCALLSSRQTMYIAKISQNRTRQSDKSICFFFYNKKKTN